MPVEELSCKKCGGAIDQQTMTCQYCLTPYVFIPTAVAPGVAKPLACPKCKKPTQKEGLCGRCKREEYWANEEEWQKRASGQKHFRLLIKKRVQLEGEGTRQQEFVIYCLEGGGGLDVLTNRNMHHYRQEGVFQKKIDRWKIRLEDMEKVEAQDWHSRGKQIVITTKSGEKLFTNVYDKNNWMYYYYNPTNIFKIREDSIGNFVYHCKLAIAYRKKKIKDPGWVPDTDDWDLDWVLADEYRERHSWGTS